MNWELAFWIALGVAIWNGYMWLIYWYNFRKELKSKLHSVFEHTEEELKR